MAVFKDVNFSVGNPGTGSGAVESAAGYKMLQKAMDSAAGIGMRIDEENKAKGTMELLKMKKDGKNITQADFDRVGRYDPLMLEKKLEKLRTYNRNVVTQDRNFGLDKDKADLYKQNVLSQINARDPEKKFIMDVARKEAGIGGYSGKGSSKKGKAGTLKTAASIFSDVLKSTNTDPSTIDFGQTTSTMNKIRDMQNMGIPAEMIKEMMNETTENQGMTSWLPGRDDLSFDNFKNINLKDPEFIKRAGIAKNRYNVGK